MKTPYAAAAITAFVFAGCSGGESTPNIRLVDLAPAGSLTTSAAAEVDPLAVLPPSAWKAGPGVSDLAVRDGKLVGRSSDPHPIIYAELPAWPDPADTVDSVEVDFAISAGDSVQATLTEGDEPNTAAARDEAMNDTAFLKTDVVAVLGAQTVKMPYGGTRRLDQSRFLHLSPTNEADAEFQIEAVRLITTRERLAATPSGISWQGLADIFRESIVSRSPETFGISVVVPQDAWLDLNLGSLDQTPLTFEISLADSTPLLRRTLTTPKRWEPIAVDLADYAGRRLDLNFTLSAAEDDVIGLWGGPTVRARNAKPAVVEAPSAPAAAPPKNVIFVHLDTLRRDHLQFHGYHRETAPILAKMAAEGVLFTDNISPASWTKVATPSIVTSLYPTAHTVKNFPDRLPAAAAVVAEIYREAGYATLCYSSVMFTGKFTNLHQGYDELHEFTSLERGVPKSGREYVDRLTRWIDRHPDTPFFAYLHVFDPHSPFEPRGPYNTLWADPAGRPAQMERIKKLKPHTTEFFYRQQLATRREIEAAGVDPEALMAYHKDWYDGSIRGMDAELVRLIEALRRHDQLDDTLFVFFSDHGEEFLEHGGAFHGQSVYGDLTNVPLIFYWPGGLPKGVVIDETVRSIDIMPTALALSGLATPQSVQGQSLAPLILAARSGGDADAIRSAAIEMGWRLEPAVSENVTVADKDLRATALLSGGWRLIHNTYIPEGKERPEYELFNHVEDPLDLRDLSAEHPEIVDRLKAELAAWRESVKRQQLEADGSTEGMSQQEIDRLKNLGYIQ